MVQKQDYFSLSSIGLTSSGTIVSPPAKVENPPKTAYYITEFAGNETEVGYSFLYWNGVAFPNPLTASQPTALAYYGAISINDMVMVIDNLTISNNQSSSITADITVDIISASPANTLTSNGIPTIPPSLIKRVIVPANTTVLLSDLDLKLPLHSNIPADVPNTPATEFMSGYGIGVAFPQSELATTADNYSIEFVTVSGVAHFERA